MSQANSDSEASALFGSEEFGSGIDSGVGAGLDLGDAGGFIGQTSEEVAMAGGMAPVRPVRQKGFTLDSFLMLISMLLMLISAIILFSYMGSIEV